MELLSTDRVAQLDRIEAMLSDLVNGPKPAVVGPRDIRKLLGLNSESATYRIITELNLTPLSRGKYRRIDVENAIARRILDKQIEAKRKRLAE